MLSDDGQFFSIGPTRCVIACPTCDATEEVRVITLSIIEVDGGPGSVSMRLTCLACGFDWDASVEIKRDPRTGKGPGT